MGAIFQQLPDGSRKTARQSHIRAVIPASNRYPNMIITYVMTRGTVPIAAIVIGPVLEKYDQTP